MPFDPHLVGVSQSNPVSMATVTVTIIDAKTRAVIIDRQVTNRKEALAIRRHFGAGFDAHIRTPEYDELILSLKDQQTLN